MDKVNFVTGYMPDKPDFDKLQESLEGGLENVAASVAGMGIKTGFDATVTGSQASISAGVGFDGLGRILLKTEAITVDLGTLARPGAGLYRWVTIALRYKVTEEGQVLDINNQSNPAQYLDDVEAEIIDPGINDTAENISRPDHDEYQVPVLDIRLDESSTWENLIKDASRKPELVSVGEMPEKIADKLIPPGHIYTQYPFMPTPDVHFGFGTWENISTRAVGYGISDANNGDPTSYISREDAGQTLDFSDTDLTVDAQIQGGDYAGKYVRSVETYSGDFFRVIGGNALAFNQERQPTSQIDHKHRWLNSSNQGEMDSGTGMYGYQPGDTAAFAGAGDSYHSEIAPNGAVSEVHVGVENAPPNRSVVIWNRTV